MLSSFKTARADSPLALQSETAYDNALSLQIPSSSRYRLYPDPKETTVNVRRQAVL
jgi:hypothetical protein